MGNVPSSDSADRGDASSAAQAAPAAGAEAAGGGAGDGSNSSSRGSKDTLQGRFGGGASGRKSSAEAKGLRHLLRRYSGSKSSDRGSAESRRSSGTANHQQQSGDAGSSSGSSKQLAGSPLGSKSAAAQAGAMASPSGGGSSSAAASAATTQQQRSESPFQGASQAAGSAGSAGQQQPSPKQQGAGTSSSSKGQLSLTGQPSTQSNSGSLGPALTPSGRASFAHDALVSPYDDGMAREGLPPLSPASNNNNNNSSGSTTAGTGRAASGQPPLPPTAKHLQQQQAQNRQRLSPDVLEQHSGNVGSVGSHGAGAGESSSGSFSKGRVRASMESVGSKASSARSGAGRSTRSSFALEAAPEEGGVEVDAYGRPSFAAFEEPSAAVRGKGAVFEASLPPDLAAMYRQLAVLLPQAPVPLVTVLQLWGITDPQEAQETIQIFVMQGVLKVATLPDGASWIMPSADHQECIKALHPESLKASHEAVLEVYRRQVLVSRRLQQQQQQLMAMGGDPAAAAAAAGSMQLFSDDVAPSDFSNDGYIWLALTHHLLGAERLEQVRSLLTDPVWLEVKLHCYGVAVVVDDFRSYLHVASDPVVKAVLQAFQMSLSCCMERSHVPMMRNQLVLRLMAAAQSAAAAAATPFAAAVVATSRSSSSLRRSMEASSVSGSQIAPTAGAGTCVLEEEQAGAGEEGGALPGRGAASDAFLSAALDIAAVLGPGAAAGSGSAPAAPAATREVPNPQRMSLHSNSSAGGSAASFTRQQAEYASEMHAWYKQQYAACCAGSGLLWPHALLQQQQQQQHLPPHLLGYTASLQQAGGRHRMALRGHLGPIRRVVISPAGKDVLTASDDGGVQVWDMDIGDCILQLRLPPPPATALSPLGTPVTAAPPQPLTCLAVTPDGSCCLSGDVEGWLNCWNLSTGALVQRIRAHGGRLNAIALDRSGSRCITAGQDGAARLWSLPAAAPGMRSAGASAGMQGSPDAGGQGIVGSLALEQELSGHGGLSSVGPGAVLDVALSHDGVLGASCSDDLSVRVWDLEHRDCIKTCKGHTGWVVSLQFVGASHMLVSGSHDETARVWDAWSGECVAVLSGHSGRVNAVVTSLDGSVIITCSDDTTARVWDGYAYKLINVLEGHTSWINEAAVNHNGRRAVTASGDGTARLWDTRSATCLQVLTGHSEDVTCVVMTSKARFAVTGSLDGTAQVWDMHAQDVSNNDVHDGKVVAVVTRSDGSRAASIGTDGFLRVWDITTGECLSNKMGHTTATPMCLQLSTDGSLAYSASGARKLIRWDMATGTPCLCLQQKQGSRTKCMHLSADGTVAAVLLFDSTMSVYDTTTGQLRCELMRKGERDAIRVHSGGVNGVMVTADGSRAISWSKDTTARVWDTSTGACTLVLMGHEDSITTAALNPDETLLATASYDRTARLWALGGPNCSGSGMCLKVLQHTDPVACVAFSGSSQHLNCNTSTASAAAAGAGGTAAVQQPKSPTAAAALRRLVTGCDGHALWLWDVDSGACVAALGEHKDRVTSVAFSPDGRWMASASQDRSVLVWDAAAGHLVGLYVGDSAMVCCCFGWRGSPQPLHSPPQLANGRLPVQLSQVRPPRQAVGEEASSSGRGTPAGPAHEVGLWPGSGGLTLIAGDTTGRVHFIACW